MPSMEPVAGIRLGTACAGLKSQQCDDLVVMELLPGAVCSAVFTRNAFCAAPVKVARENLAKSPRWLLVNSGNANAGTGGPGLDDARETCRILAARVNANEFEVMPFSTGVIGERLPVDKIEQAIPSALDALSVRGWENAAKAIMTTDTRPKGASKSIQLDDESVVISGIAKGSGMIHPNMATMLSFIATDARLDKALLDRCLVDVVDQSFNCISVDGDTSTNDACVLIATGTGGASIQDGTSDYAVFMSALQGICNSLAESIVRDGEGATKLIRVSVEDAESDLEARRVAKTIAGSSLVKTAFFASDPNWGRILAAIGRANVNQFDIGRVAIWLDNVQIVSDGGLAPGYSESAAQVVMSRDDIQVRVSLGRGRASQRVLSCDLSYDYIRINSEYRT